MTAPAPVLDSPAEVRPARLQDLVGLGRLFLASLGFWTAVGLVFAGQFALMQVGSVHRMPLHQLVVGELDELVALRPAHAGRSWPPRCGSARPDCRSRGCSSLHAIGAGLFVAVGGALMGTVENLLPWTPSRPRSSAAGSRHPPLSRPRPPDLLPGRRRDRGLRPRLGVAPPRDRRGHLRPPARRGAAARAERAAPAALSVQHPARDLRPDLRGPARGPNGCSRASARCCG